MRRYILCTLLVSAVACGHDGNTGPEATLIAVRVRDDVGKSAGRNVIIVSRSGTTMMTAQTQTDGTTELRVGEAGSYLVTVVPRAGYTSGTDPLSKSVTAVANARAQVDFTLYREGAPPPESPIIIAPMRSSPR